MDNPIKKRIDELGISTHSASRMLGITQTNVWKHYHGKRRLSFDSVELYNNRLGIPMNDLKAWNKYLKQKIQEEKDANKDQSPQGGNSSTDPV